MIIDESGPTLLYLDGPLDIRVNTEVRQMPPKLAQLLDPAGDLYEDGTVFLRIGEGDLHRPIILVLTPVSRDALFSALEDARNETGVVNDL